MEMVANIERRRVEITVSGREWRDAGGGRRERDSPPSRLGPNPISLIITYNDK